MGASVRPERTGLTLADGRNVNDLPPADMWDALVQHGVPADRATQQVAAVHGPPPAPQGPGVVARAAAGVVQGIGHMIAHPIDTIQQAATSYVTAPFTAAVAPGVGESRVNSASVAVPQPDGSVAIRNNRTGLVTRVPAGQPTTYDAEHGGVTEQERTAAGAQSAVNILLPRLLAGAGAATKALPTSTRLLARTAAAGAGGAAAGAAYSPNDPAAGAMAGAFLAPVMEAGGRAVGRMLPNTAAQNTVRSGVVQALGGQTVEDAAKGDMLKQLGRSRMSLDDFAAAAKNALPSETALDIGGDAMVSRAGGAVATPSRGAVDIRRVLGTRNTEQPGRVLSNLTQTMGVGARANTVQQAADLVSARSEAAAPMYTRAYAAPPIDDPEVLATLSDPVFQKAFKRGQRIAAIDGTIIPDLTKESTVGGQTITEQVPQSTQAIDYTKRGMDDLIESKMRSGSMGRTEARALRQRMNGMLQRVDQINPDYATARQMFAGHSAMMDAHEAGMNFLNTPHDEIAATFPQMSQGEQTMFRKGALASMEDYLGRTTDGNDVTTKLRNPLIRDKMRTIFPDPDNAAAFEDAVQREGQMRARSNSILANSKTAERVAQMGDAAGPGMGNAAMAMATGNPAPLLKFGLGAALKQRAAGLTEQQVNALAPMLTTQGPVDLNMLAQQLRDYSQRRASQRSIGSPRVAGQVAGEVTNR